MITFSRISTFTFQNFLKTFKYMLCLLVSLSREQQHYVDPKQSTRVYLNN